MLNIAKNIHAGWNTGNIRDTLPEAEIIPIGESANERKKMVRLTAKYLILKEFENNPLPGFTLHSADRKSWSSADQTWLVIDPRGFVTRITTQNLQDILHVTGITEGLIQEKCVWAREDSKTAMILLPVSSPAYKAAVENTALIESKVSIKDVSIGDMVQTQHGITGEFMGTLSLYGPIDSYSFNSSYDPQIYLRRQIIRTAPGFYYYATDAKILLVSHKTTNPRTREESVTELNNEIATSKPYFSSNSNMPTGIYRSVSGMIKHVSTHAVPKLTLTFDEIDKATAIELFHAGCDTYDVGLVILEAANGTRYLIDHASSSYQQALVASDINAFDVIKVQHYADASITKIVLDSRRKVRWQSGAPGGMVSIDNFVKFYKIVKYVKHETYV